MVFGLAIIQFLDFTFQNGLKPSMLLTLTLKTMSGSKSGLFLTSIFLITRRNRYACKNFTSLKKWSVLEFIAVTLWLFLQCWFELISPLTVFWDYYRQYKWKLQVFLITQWQSKIENNVNFSEWKHEQMSSHLFARRISGNFR